MIDLFGISDLWGAIEDIWIRLQKLETALAQVIEDGPKFGRALNNEIRISALEQRLNETISQYESGSSTVQLPDDEMSGQLVAVPDTRD